MKKISWFILFLLLAVSCLNTPDCYRLNNNFVGISFRKMFDGQVDTVGIVKVTIDGYDSVFFGSKYYTGLSQPVNYLTDSSIVRIETLEGVYVLPLGYKAKPEFVSKECGQRYILSELAIGKISGIDSIQLFSSSLSNPAQLNIGIYRCPRNNMMKLSFRQLYLDTVSRGKLDTRAITSITDDFLGTVYENTSLSTIHLAINTYIVGPDSTNSTTFTFNFADGTSNNLSVGYSIAYSYGPKKVYSCGKLKFPHKLDTIQQDFEVLHITNDSIHDAPVTNIETFRCPITNEIKAVFKNAKGNTVVDTLKSVTVNGVLQYDSTVTNTIIIPLATNANETTIVFEYPGGATKTLKLGYATTPSPYHINVCKNQFVLTNLVVNDGTAFKDVKVTDVNVKFPAVNNLAITK